MVPEQKGENKMKTSIVILAIIWFAISPIFANNLMLHSSLQKFKVGDLVYICNEDPKDNTPLCITDYSSKIIAVKYFVYGNEYEYQVQVYSDKPIESWNTKWWVIQKYVHKW